MGAQIIQNNVQFFTGIEGDQLIHEIQKLPPAAAPIMARMNQPARHLQRGKERGGAVTLVFVSEAG